MLDGKSRAPYQIIKNDPAAILHTKIVFLKSAFEKLFAKITLRHAKIFNNNILSSEIFFCFYFSPKYTW